MLHYKESPYPFSLQANIASHEVFSHNMLFRIFFCQFQYVFGGLEQQKVILCEYSPQVLITGR